MTRRISIASVLVLGGLVLAAGIAGWLVEMRSSLPLRRAISELQLAVALEPDNPKAHFYLSQAYERSGRIQDAIAHYERAVDVSPGTEWGPLAELALARLYRNQGAYAESLRAAQRAAELTHEKRTKALVEEERALTYQAMGEPQRALEHLQLATELEPSWARLEITAGDLCREQGDLATAVKHYRRAVAQPQDNAWRHYLLGRALLELGETNEGMQELDRALELAPGGRSGLRRAVETLRHQYATRAGRRSSF